MPQCSTSTPDGQNLAEDSRWGIKNSYLPTYNQLTKNRTAKLAAHQDSCRAASPCLGYGILCLHPQHCFTGGFLQALSKTRGLVFTSTILQIESDSSPDDKGSQVNDTNLINIFQQKKAFAVRLPPPRQGTKKYMQFDFEKTTIESGGSSKGVTLPKIIPYPLQWKGKKPNT